MSTYTALKPVYNRRTKQYDLDVVQDACLMAVHSGYFVYDDPTTARQMILDARCLTLWAPKKVDAIMAYLDNAILNSK